MMTIQIALDRGTNDIIKLDGGGIARVRDGRYTVQLVKNKLLTLLGEWLLDPSKGWLNFDDYVRNPDLFDIEMRAREVILSTDGVQKIDTMSLELTGRVLYLTFTATTIYGGIELTVPWST